MNKLKTKKEVHLIEYSWCVNYTGSEAYNSEAHESSADGTDGEMLAARPIIETGILRNCKYVAALGQEGTGKKIQHSSLCFLILSIPNEQF